MSGFVESAGIFRPNAAYVDFDRKQVTLYSGEKLPIVRICTDNDEEIDDAELDLHDEIAIVYGPDSEGTLWMHPMRRGDRDTMQ